MIFLLLFLDLSTLGIVMSVSHLSILDQRIFGRPSISRPVSQAILSSCADMLHIYVLPYIIFLYLFEGICVIGHGTGNGVVENVFADILIP